MSSLGCFFAKESDFLQKNSVFFCRRKCSLAVFCCKERTNISIRMYFFQKNVFTLFQKITHKYFQKSIRLYFFQKNPPMCHEVNMAHLFFHNKGAYTCSHIYYTHRYVCTYINIPLYMYAHTHTHISVHIGCIHMFIHIICTDTYVQI